MKRMPLLAAAILPLAVNAADKDLANWDVEKVKDNQRLSTILDAQVQAADGSEIAQVHDVVFDRNGRASVLLEPGEELETVDDASEAERRDAAGDVSMTEDPRTPDSTNYQATDDLGNTSPEEETTGLARVEWDEVNYDEDSDAIVLETSDIAFTESLDAYAETSRAMDDVAIAETRGDGSLEDQTRPIANRGESIAASEEAPGEDLDASTAGHVLASDLVGMDVNLADEDSFGRIEDVLLNEQGEAEAFVVDSWDLVDKQRFALPADIAAVDPGTGEISLSYSADEVGELEEFEFEDLESDRM